MSNKERERRKNDAKYGNLVIKTSLEIDMDQEKWTLPCCRSLKKYVVRDKRYIKEKYKEFNDLDALFDDVDKILSVSIFFCFFFSFKKNFQDTAISPRLGWFVCFLLPTLGFIVCSFLLVEGNMKQFLIFCALLSIPLFVVVKLFIILYESIIHALFGKKRKNYLSLLKERWNR